MRSNSDMPESRFLGSISASSLRNFLPKSSSGKHKWSSNWTKQRPDAENQPPVNSNIQIDINSTLGLPNRNVGAKSVIMQQEEVAGLDTKQEEMLELEAQPDPSVKVVVRIRPASTHVRGDLTVGRVSGDTVAIGDRKLTFDAVLDSNSHQEEMFNLVGVPLVNDALAGYNTSVLAYGQTGSGKTYTMWGPPSAMVDSCSTNSHQGIVPRIFQKLFSEIQRDQDNSSGKQINYQLRCSFLEIYNDQIGDLLDPTQRNLEIKDDAKHGFYVENLTEEYVTSYDDITQILIKGLSSRKVGATSLNSKSSRSHIVFTCVIESWCKGMSANCFGSSKSSRISLVDLAGIERNKLDDTRHSAKEEKNVKKSLSQLGYLVNLLAEGAKSGKPEDDSYRSTSLTHLLKESLGGNVKLSVICTISKDSKSSGETLSTLRFGQRAKCILNDPVVNEISEDDVNDLSDQIRQLKEELIRAKTDTRDSIASSIGSHTGHARESLNQLRLSINRSLLLPSIDDIDETEDMKVTEDDLREIHMQLDNLHSSDGTGFCSLEENSDTELTSEHYGSCLEESETEEISIEESKTKMQASGSFDSIATINTIRSSISVSSSFPYSPFLELEEPTLSESPKIVSNPRKSVTFASSHLVAGEDANQSDNAMVDSNVLRRSLGQNGKLQSSLRSSKIFPGPTEMLAASLHRGLQIIDYHQQQQNSAPRSSLSSFSFEHLALKASPSIDKRGGEEDKLPTFICSSCQKVGPTGFNEVDEAEDSTDGRKHLEKLSMEQAAKIEQLNLLVEQYKHELEQYKSTLGSTCTNESMLLKWKEGENGEQVITREAAAAASTFDVNEKEELLNEIQTLRRTLQSQTEGGSGRIRSSLLSQSIQMRKSGTYPQINTTEDLEKERERWMEMESDWISLTDELRIDLDNIRQRAEKAEMELKLEKNCTEELDDALGRSVLCHARMVEHYADLQEKHNELFDKHRLIMRGIADVKKAAAKAGAKGHGSRFSKCLAGELSVLRVEREKERELLRKENKSLKVQLRDTAEAVQAAGELLVRLKEAEATSSMAEENVVKLEEEKEKMKRQLEKMKKKHKMEIATMKHYLNESRLPESALKPLYNQETNSSSSQYDDDQEWRAEFGAIYQDHHY
ncbi:kinesin-like protein KIN-12F [Impatiens glandulifera]|uniref:kinesin-like protein KIN-12F n=1 Tax=Impatiens glandulifera TaxID=253017 RepID=UPI001FB0BE74|nr:kinesin-like protein KIN-12F [Impatiens glandulifera]